jgi:hypothetical protein
MHIEHAGLISNIGLPEVERIELSRLVEEIEGIEKIPKYDFKYYFEIIKENYFKKPAEFHFEEVKKLDFGEIGKFHFYEEYQKQLPPFEFLP